MMRFLVLPLLFLAAPALADEAGPHGIVKFGEGVSHGLDWDQD